MNGAFLAFRLGESPRPDLLCDERQERSKEPQEELQRLGQRGQSGFTLGRVVVGVGALLDQLQIVVAEAPELFFRNFERGRVVELLEGVAGVDGGLLQTVEEVQVHLVGDKIHGEGVQVGIHTLKLGEHETARVEELGGELFTHLQDPFVESGVGAQAGSGSPVAHAVG